MSLWIILAFILILPLDIPGLIRNRKVPELITYGVLWTLALGLACLVIYGVRTDYITAGLEAIFEPLTQPYLKPPPM